MTGVYLRQPERPFKLWKWLVFGPLFLLSLDYISFRLRTVEIAQVSFVLGYLITIRMIGMQKLAWVAKLLGGLGLSLAISFIASLSLFGVCAAQQSIEFCALNNLSAHIFGNFVFPLIIVIVWVAVETLGSVGKTINYVIRYWKR